MIPNRTTTFRRSTISTVRDQVGRIQRLVANHRIGLDDAQHLLNLMADRGELEEFDVAHLSRKMARIAIAGEGGAE